jgi:hypothetical protein
MPNHFISQNGRYHNRGADPDDAVYQSDIRAAFAGGRLIMTDGNW